jgi:hypothetical protein
MKIYLYPRFVSLSLAAHFSPKFFSFLESQGLQLEVEHWGGNLVSLPTTPSIIQASGVMNCYWSELGKKCAELGHLCFFSDGLVKPNGEYTKYGLIEAAKKFLGNQKAKA